MRTLTAIAAFLILLFLGFLIWSLSAPDPRPRSQDFKTEQERAEIKARMARHGINSAILDRETGERYFYNSKGQKCRL